MTMTELKKQYMAEQKRIKVIQWNKERKAITVKALHKKSLNSLWKLIESNLERVEHIQREICGYSITLKTESFLQSKYEYNRII